MKCITHKISTAEEWIDYSSDNSTECGFNEWDSSNTGSSTISNLDSTDVTPEQAKNKIPLEVSYITLNEASIIESDIDDMIDQLIERCEHRGSCTMIKENILYIITMFKLSYIEIQYSNFLLNLLYESHPTVSIDTIDNIHRMIVTVMSISNKIINDSPYLFKAWKQLTNIEINILKNCEREFLKLIKYKTRYIMFINKIMDEQDRQSTEKMMYMKNKVTLI